MDTLHAAFSSAVPRSARAHRTPAAAILTRHHRHHGPRTRSPSAGFARATRLPLHGILTKRFSLPTSNSLITGPVLYQEPPGHKRHSGPSMSRTALPTSPSTPPAVPSLLLPSVNSTISPLVHLPYTIYPTGLSSNLYMSPPGLSSPSEANSTDKPVDHVRLARLKKLLAPYLLPPVNIIG